MLEEKDKVYISIDLKSFYASVECVERGFDPLTTNLVVADIGRTEKTICLAVSPSLKQYGIPGRARLFEVIKSVKNINYIRKKCALNHTFEGISTDSNELKRNAKLELGYIIAPPRMSCYMKYSNNIYKIYLKYFAPEDIYVYSIDEVFCDITKYLKLYNMSPKALVTKIIQDIYKSTGITATAGIGTNLYLAKVAMDIVAKHVRPDKNGVRIAILDEMSYRKLLWNHTPITDFWRVGNGCAKKLEKCGIFTMGDVAKVSVENEDLLYNLFGVNAELLIDHSWGYENTAIESIKSYTPTASSLSLGQVLHTPYNYNETRLIVKEMTEQLTLDLVKKDLVTNQIVLTVGYDIQNLNDEKIRDEYNGDITIDRYGRKIPKHSHGTINLEYMTSSTVNITKAVIKLFEKIINKKLLVRRINISANKVVSKKSIQKERYKQISLFEDFGVVNKEENLRKINEQKEEKLNKAIVKIKDKYGKNSVIKGMNLEQFATTIKRNAQIGGHNA